jgi:hypothetical protein
VSPIPFDFLPKREISVPGRVQVEGAGPWMSLRNLDAFRYPLFRNIGTNLPCPICFLPPTSVGGLVGDLALFGT